MNIPMHAGGRLFRTLMPMAAIAILWGCGANAKNGPDESTETTATAAQRTTPEPGSAAAAQPDEEVQEVSNPAETTEGDGDGGDSEHAGRKPIPPPEAIAQLPTDGGPDYNRLVFEKSPYLLQHAGNPVDWYPWGEEAFEKARAEDKPIFLSIGYSTCHWCHVMERESFEDEEVGALMNEHFVSIKVDREERPDIDQIYMAVTQAYSGSGGWPMTIIMMPDRRPFFAGTYFPKHGRSNRPGMMELIPAIAELWDNEREKLEGSASQILTHLKQNTGGSPGTGLGEQTLTTAFSLFTQRFDAERGGFGQAPKFPTPHNHLFLLRYWRRTGDETALRMVETTLQAMRKGGIFDHVGFGFHRYSTDADWLLPHFEKMLYDQAMLTMAYTEAYQATGKEEYAQTAREILTYVLRDMTSPEGGFYSAEDADSEGEEGKFNVWSNDEVLEVLGAEAGEIYLKVFNFEEAGNFFEQSTRQRMGTNIPHLQKSIAEWAAELHLAEEPLATMLEDSRRKLFDVRERRIHPLKDDKILTDWNGLMIAALAKAARALGDEAYTEAAVKAADFILDTMRKSDGRLLHRYRQGDAALDAHLEDYAYVVWAMLEVYEATFDVKYLEAAIELNRSMLDHFWDAEGGGLFMAADDGEKLLVRAKEIYDGAQPSGNSVAALNLLRLGRITGDASLETKSDEIMKAFTGEVGRYPAGFSMLLAAVDFAVGPSHEIVISGVEGADDVKAMVDALRGQYIPNKVVLFRPDGPGTPAISSIAEFTEPQTSLDGKATAYVCLNYACKLPTTAIEEMLKSVEPSWTP